MAASTMKGLLKGLRYISQMFDGSEEEEPDMQIGNPTDVKHVAHIGWDGPAVQNSPSWMDGFNPPKETSSAPLTFPDNPNARPPSEDSSEAKSGEKKNSRRRHSTSETIDGHDISSGVKPRRHNHHSSLELDTSSTNASSPPSIPKKSRKKKSKDSSVGGEGSSGKCRTKGHKKSDSSGIPSPKPKSKSKDMDCPTAAMKGMGLDEKMDSAAGCRQVLEL